MIDAAMLFYFQCSYTTFGIISTALNTFLLLLVLLDSPKAMGVYKWFLVNQTVSDLAASLFVNCLYRPVYLFVARAVLTTGPLKYLSIDYAGISAATFMTFETWNMLSLTLCFVSRYASVAANRVSEFVHGPRGYILMTLKVVTLCLGTGIFTWSTTEMDSITLLNNTVALEPRLLEIIDRVVVTGAVVHPNETSTMRKTVSTICTVFGLYVVGFIVVMIATCAFLTIKILRECRSSLSPATYKLQRQLTFTLIIQCGYPLVVAVVPVLLLTAYLKLKWPAFAGDSTWFPLFFTVTMQSLHTCNALTTLVLVNVYRRALMRRLQTIVGFFTAKKTTTTSTRTTSNAVAVSGARKR